MVFESSVLTWIRSRIRIEQKCWIRICNESIRIHNPATYTAPWNFLVTLLAGETKKSKKNIFFMCRFKKIEINKF
jgi:hypothetical protein